jgi:hypothetical protein
MKLTKWLYTTVASVAAGLLASKLVKWGWRAFSGDKPPEDAEDLTESTLQVTLFAAILALAVTVSQTLATRKALTLLAKREAKDLGLPTG